MKKVGEAKGGRKKSGCPKPFTKGFDLTQQDWGLHLPAPPHPHFPRRPSVLLQSSSFSPPPNTHTKNMQKLFYQEVLFGEHVDALPAQVTQAGV